MPAPPWLHVVFHGHFYQPPREDPWLEEVEAEPSAAPFHDWNQRIEQECYRAVAAARIPGHEGRILRITNTLEQLSFNFGPTLLEWMEGNAPATYAAILTADQRSAARLGHGNAIAMPYHHAILPLSTRREKITEVRWGIADFRRRFGRDPEGMWLPETAVDHETLEVLAGEGIRFTVLAPHQVVSAPPTGEPGLYRCPGGETIALFIYDGPISHDVAFGPLVRDSALWVRRTIAPDPPQPLRRLVSVATDGETYGHHHVFGEMALALTLDRLIETPGVKVENFASYLADHPAKEPVELVSPSSWSCPHGVERWRANCGCRIATELPARQEWRKPLREALAWLTAELHARYDQEAAAHLRDPILAREQYGTVVGAAPEVIRAYVISQALHPQDAASLTRAAELLELERGALRSLTSCAWFFDDLGGIETLQVLRYAAWATQLAVLDQTRLEAGLVECLAPARSRDPLMGTGADIYLQRARPRIPPDARIAGGLALLQAIAPSAADGAAHVLEQHADHRVLRHRRTGRAVWCQLSTEIQDEDPVAAIALEGQPVIRLGLEDVPERAREAVSRELRRTALHRLLTTDEREAIAGGDEARTVVRRALLAATHDLAFLPSRSAAARVSELTRLLRRLGQEVPFEVQTVFYGIWSGGHLTDPHLVRLARELGFDTPGTA